MATDRKILLTDLAQQQIQLAADYGMALWGRNFINAMHALIPGKGFESPLEAVFYAWWEALSQSEGWGDVLALRHQHELQTRNRTYRLDFAVYQIGYLPSLGVELDGHDFHERTREQVALRNQRDRDLAATGWVLLHFSGSELVRDPVAVIHEVTRTASTTLRFAEKGPHGTGPTITVHP